MVVQVKNQALAARSKIQSRRFRVNAEPTAAAKVRMDVYAHEIPAVGNDVFGRIGWCFEVGDSANADNLVMLGSDQNNAPSRATVEDPKEHVSLTLGTASRAQGDEACDLVDVSRLEWSDSDCGVHYVDSVSKVANGDVFGKRT